MDLIKELLNIPTSCEVNDIIPKDLIFSETNITKQDKEIFVKFVKQIRWIYKIDNSTLRVLPFADDERDYPEMEVINITLKPNFQTYNHNTGNYHRYDARLDRIVDIMLRFIPYPILLSCRFKDEIKFYVSHIKESQADADKITLDELIHTEWIKTTELTDLDNDLFNKLQLDNLNLTNVYTCYDSIVTAIIQYNGSKEVGHTVNLDSNQIQEIMDEIYQIDRTIADYRVQMRREDNFNRKVEWNIKIKQLQIDKKLLQDKLE